MTDQDAIVLSIVGFEILARTGETKADHPFLFPSAKYYSCYLCQYSNTTRNNYGCNICPYFLHFGKVCLGDEKNPSYSDNFRKWKTARNKIDRAYYANRFLSELKQLVGNR
jgi:hypothetical protein